tara:strand:- start:9201 stop:9491 length:291 start_codon:yes stop_codon:yes gene_type:complete
MAIKKTDPVKKKKKPAAKKTTVKRGQQLSDKLAKSVIKGKMTYAGARKVQRKQDSVASLTTRVGKKTKGSSQSLGSKRKYTKAKFKIDKRGNKVAN